MPDHDIAPSNSPNVQPGSGDFQAGGTGPNLSNFELGIPNRSLPDAYFIKFANNNFSTPEQPGESE